MSNRETPKTPPRVAKRNPALPENTANEPTLPGIEPAKALPILDPVAAELMERLRLALEANTARLALPAVPAGPQEVILSPALLKTIEGRVIERVAPVLMQILTELRAAAALAQSLPVQLQEAGATARTEIVRTANTAHHAARLVSAETRHVIEDLNAQGRAQIVEMHEHARSWTQGLARYTRRHLQDTAREAVEGMSTATAEVRELADQLGVTASTVEECADAILYVAPALTQHHEVRTRAIIRSGSLTTVGLIFAGLAIVAAVLWWAGRLP